jgi:malonyl-CoA decarboxylase
MPTTSNLVRWLVNSIADRGRSFLNHPSRSSLEQLCEDLVSERGEASGMAIALEISGRYAGFNDAEKLSFFKRLLGSEWLADPKQILALAQAYHANPSPAELAKLFPAAEPRRQELFRRINMSPRGTEAIVGMRHDLLRLLPRNETLEPINADLLHLLSSWFNRGFLELRRIDWRTPALVLEKLITYEAVHEIQGWPDLRRRLERDRRCFAFFHPALPDEPLIFVEVALTQGMAAAIQPLIDLNSKPDEIAKADTAVFYSISNCLEGLRNISFGAFLIKQVVHELQTELPGLKHFVTLSPIPRFREWLSTQKLATHKPLLDTLPDLAKLAKISLAKTVPKPQNIPNQALLKACAKYLTMRRKDGRAYDPVAAFHLSNGASIERLNWMGDVSDKGMRQSYGLMVNYAYRPLRIERNHEQYAKHGKFAMSEEVNALLEKPENKP